MDRTQKIYSTEREMLMRETSKKVSRTSRITSGKITDEEKMSEEQKKMERPSLASWEVT